MIKGVHRLRYNLNSNRANRVYCSNFVNSKKKKKKSKTQNKTKRNEKKIFWTIKSSNNNAFRLMAFWKNHWREAQRAHHPPFCFRLGGLRQGKGNSSSSISFSSKAFTSSPDPPNWDLYGHHVALFLVQKEVNRPKPSALTMFTTNNK